MKKLALIIVIITLPIIGFFQYKNWTKFSSNNNYDYQISDQIDLGYFDQELVKNYFKNSQEIGSYARSLWFTYDIDVLNYDQKNQETKSKVTYYEFLLAQTKRYEKLLEKSSKLKKEGYNNLQIEQILKNGISLKDYQQKEAINKLINVKFGDVSQAVYSLQKKLTEKGYTTPHDGNFKSSTQEKLKTFQLENDLAPTGTIDEETLIKLLYK